jgi:mitogen-activated protein kinase organizer 1
VTNDAQTMLVTTLNSEIHLMDRTDGSELQRYTGHKNTSYRIHNTLGHGEATVLGGDEDGKLWEWDLADGKHVKTEQKIHAKSVLWVEQHPDPAVNQCVTAGGDGSVQVWKMG